MRAAVLVSGSGTILRAMVAAGVPVAVVVSDRPCPALEVAREAGVEAQLVDRRRWGGSGPEFDRQGYTEALTALLSERSPDLVAMAGFGTVLAEPVHAAFGGRILNTHPALLPAFPGWHAVADALAAGVAVTGCTVHLATLEMDAGPVLAQEEVAVVDGGHRGLAPRADQGGRAAALPGHRAAGARRAGADRLARGHGRGGGGGPGVRALLSVYDKTGLVELAGGLADLGWELVASGNTSAALAEAGIDHLGVSEVTGSPEMLGGRVKTLHPRIHGGILADRSRPEHLADLEAQGIDPVDLVVCNLYPFATDPSVELIDVGGPTMVRAAAKNFAHVGVVTSPADYDGVLAELRRDGALSPATRRRLSRAAFAHTAAYDAAIVAWFDGEGDAAPAPVPERTAAEAALAPTIHLTLERAEILRYGENPHQSGARYRMVPGDSWWDRAVQHGGSALSYLNLFDADAAWRLVHELAADAAGRDPALGAAVAIIKHANPCGAAVAVDLATAYRLALDCDPTSAFGGIVALGGPVTADVAEAVAAGPQADVVVAPSFEAGRPRAAGGPAQGHPAALGAGPRAGHPPAAEPRRRRCSSRTPTASWPTPPPGRWSAGSSRPRPSGSTWCWPGGSAAAPPPTPSPSSAGPRRWGWAPGSSPGWWRPRSRWPRPASGPGAPPRPATPSSPSPTASRSWPGPGWRRWSSRGDRCATTR